MKWDYVIRSCSFGGYKFAKGLFHNGGQLAPDGIGYTMPSFIEYTSSHYDTLPQAVAAAKKTIAKEEHMDKSEINIDELVQFMGNIPKRRKEDKR